MMVIGKPTYSTHANSAKLPFVAGSISEMKSSPMIVHAVTTFAKTQVNAAPSFLKSVGVALIFVFWWRGATVAKV